MREGKDLILATKPFASEVRSSSWFHLWTTLALLAGALTCTLLLPYFVLRLAASILAGLLIVRMFVIYHDHQHHTILQHSPIANAVMTVFGLYILAPASIWKRSHDYHHKNNSKLFSASIGSYPIATRHKFEQMNVREKRAYLFTRHPLTILSGYLSMFLIGMCVQSFLSSPRKHMDSLLAIILHVSGSVAIFYFLGWEAWLLFVFLPFSIACGIGAYLFYAQHNFPGVTFKENEDWCYHDAALLSSSYMVMSPLMNWFTGNIGYHHIHHLNAKIPFYRLPEVMAKIPELQRAKTTSWRLKDVMACCRLKIWDSKLQRMISLREAAMRA
ncbi:omega-6 fatty acid desaturase (delta-12 desaturase) [Chitinophaga jiangningensis]|uniref:Omega-6 fatty acid desaturase (Delta-12 desaturase) n=1 Tax=Chitinophaga jiangningensis TaxID=1419482 RepID=A0A1M7IQ63_9BACT|nr:fatty acid desaturase [Chitinophaga jiangningensis]SHM42956.1 omega-6 fatty acid desaturase (delta-12 desaturase) [Chitinophaga jiangningensis]